MKRSYVELTCDQCGQADHYRPGNVDALARENGWIITRDGKHFCDAACRDAYRVHQRPAVPADTNTSTGE